MWTWAAGNPTPAEQISYNSEWGAPQLFLARVAMCEECSLLHAQANCTFFVHTTERHPNPMHEWKRRWAPIHRTKLQRDALTHISLHYQYCLFIIYYVPLCLFLFVLYLNLSVVPVVLLARQAEDKAIPLFHLPAFICMLHWHVGSGIKDASVANLTGAIKTGKYSSKLWLYDCCSHARLFLFKGTSVAG